MDEPSDTNFLGTLEEDVSTVHVSVCKCVGVTKTQINMGLSGKVEDSVNLMSLETVHDLRRICDISMVKGEISLVIEGSCVVERCTII